MMEDAGKQMMNMSHPVAKGAAVAATGYVASKALLKGGLLRNPWVMLGLGLVAGYFIHKHRDELLVALSKASGMGKDFMLQQQETLADLMEEAKVKEAQGNEPQA
jgi:hypothetical protein